MAVDEFIAAVQNEPFQLPVDPEDVVAGENDGVDAKFPGLLSEGAVGEADHGHIDGPAEVLQQHMDMGLGSACVAAADEMDNFHGSLRKKTCEKEQNVVK